MKKAKPNRTRLVADLFRVGAVKTGHFKLASGKESHYYVDLKLALCRPLLLRDTAARMVKLARKHIPSSIQYSVDGWIWAGVELGGIPLVTACALKCPWNYVMVRKMPKNHGTGNLIEGPYKEGQKVVLVEDVVTTGGSSLRAIEALRAAKLEPFLVLAVVDREDGGREAFEKLGIQFSALVTGAEILSTASTLASKI